MNRSPIRFLTAPLLIVCFVLPAAAQEDSRAKFTIETESPQVDLPITFAKVWFKADTLTKRGKSKTFKQTGDLTITEEGLDFVSSKGGFFFALDALTIVTRGTLPGDVSTAWVVIGVREGESVRTIAFRDGHKMGYGADTDRIHSAIRSAARQHGAAQFETVDGFQPYTHVDEHISLLYRTDWNAYVVSSIGIGDGPPLGVTVFSPVPSDDLKSREGDRALRRAHLGEAPTIVLERRVWQDGERCQKPFSKAAIERLLDHAAADPVFNGADDARERLTASQIEIAGCHGVKVQGQVGDRLIEQRVLAHQGTLFRFGIHGRPENIDALRQELDGMLSTIKLPLAQL